MTRATYVIRDGQLVEKHLAAPLDSGSSLYIHSDTMEPTLNHADGRLYTSKKTYTRAVQAAGCDIVGNERAALDRRAQRPEASTREIGRDIKQAIDQLRSR